MIFSLSGSRLWGPYKELYHTISLIASKRCPDPYQELEAVIRKHKPDFIALLKNPVSQDHVSMEMELILKYRIIMQLSLFISVWLIKQNP